MSERRIGPRYHERLGALVRERLPEASAGPTPGWLARRFLRRERRGPNRWLAGGALAAALGVLALLWWPRGGQAPRGRAGLMGSVAPGAGLVQGRAPDRDGCAHTALGPTGVDVTARPSDQPWVWLGDDGRLVYRQDEQGDRVPDFSFAGYHHGEVEPPRIAAAAPALGPGGDDDTPAIQAALDEVARRPPDARGFRGAVELEAGVFTLRGPLRITTGGVVLRGRGSGTVLRAVGAFHPALVLGAEGNRLRFRTGHVVTEAHVPVGATSMTVADVKDLHVGDEVVLERPSTRGWACALGMDALEARADGDAIKPWEQGTELRIDRRITAIDGLRLSLDAPLPAALEQRYTEATVRRYRLPQRISEVGVEGLAFEAAFSGPLDAGVENALLDVVAVDDGWLRNVTVSGETPVAVRLGKLTRRITVRDAVVSSELPRAIGFLISGQLLLVERSRAEGANLRAILTTAATAGPNAVVDFAGRGEGQVVETQRRWAVGLLLDRVRLTDGAGRPTGVISIANQGNRGSGHGWSGANSMVWNSTARWMVVDSPPTARNWVTGGEALSLFGTGSFAGVGTPAAPASLHQAQRRDRLGR